MSETDTKQDLSMQELEQALEQQSGQLLMQQDEQTATEQDEQTTTEQPKQSFVQQLKTQVAQKVSSLNNLVNPKKRMRKYPPIHFGFHRVMLALVCAVVAVLIIVWVVDLTSPDISTKVEAIQVDIDAVYPKYTPRGYSLSDITSESGKVVLNFTNSELDGAYTLTEKNPSWEKGETFESYVWDNYGDSYTKMQEGGIEIYLGNRGAAWMSGGVLFELSITSGTLTRKQIVTIATTR